MTPELLKTEADNCDAQSGLSPAPLFGLSRYKLQYRIEKWKAEKANKQREMLILKTEVETLERTIGEIEDILNQTNNKL